MKFSVDTGQLQSMVGNLNSTLQSISKNKTSMYNALETLNGMWEGEAHDVFVSRCNEDHKEMQSLIRDLQNLFNDIGKARQDYDNCENENKRLASGLSV